MRYATARSGAQCDSVEAKNSKVQGLVPGIPVLRMRRLRGWLFGTLRRTLIGMTDPVSGYERVVVCSVVSGPAARNRVLVIMPASTVRAG